MWLHGVMLGNQRACWTWRVVSPPGADGMSEVILEAKSLTRHFAIRSRFLGLGAGEVVKAVDGVDLSVRLGETLALVGESGCGKTTLGRLLIGLVQPTCGMVCLRGTSLPAIHRRRLRKSLQIVFQDPLSSLNPRKSIRHILGRPLAIHGLLSADPDVQIRALLSQVDLNVDTLARYPHEFSGGQQQRIAIARALATQPEVIVADEPVSALDVSVQAQIVSLLAALRQQMGLTLVIITHDLALVKYMADRVAVMYMGRIVEQGSAEAVLANPLHPYTRGLLASIGVSDPSRRGTRKALQGELPSPIHPPPGCLFQTRCPIRMTICERVVPVLIEREPGQAVACHAYTPEK